MSFRRHLEDIYEDEEIFFDNNISDNSDDESVSDIPPLPERLLKPPVKCYAHLLLDHWAIICYIIVLFFLSIYAYILMSWSVTEQKLEGFMWSCAKFQKCTSGTHCEGPIGDIKCLAAEFSIYKRKYGFF